MKNELDIAKVREQFPTLRAPGKRLAYLDSASSSLTPDAVLNAMDGYYREYRANVHRGMYKASELATARYEEARRKVADLVRADEREIVFTSGTTAALNLVAYGLAQSLGAGDEVVLTVLEHHANLVPWQQLGKQNGFAVKFIPLTADHEIDLEAAAKLIGPNTKVVSFALVSNVLGTVAPAEKLVALARKAGATVVIDAAQAVGRIPVDVRRLDCDFLAFSAHKACGPTGVGALYGKAAALASLPPFLYGGDMIREVRFDDSTFNEAPWKFEAGTPNVAGVIGFGSAADWLRETGVEAIRRHEESVAAYAVEQLRAVPGVRIVGPSLPVGLVSFEVEGIHPHDVTTILDAEGVATRGGHHCAMPLLQALNLKNGTTRASFGPYTATEDVDQLVAGVRKARKIFRLD